MSLARKSPNRLIYHTGFHFVALTYNIKIARYKAANTKGGGEDNNQTMRSIIDR